MVQENTSHAQSCMVTDLHAHTNNEERRPLGRDGGDGFLPEMGRCDAEKATEQVRGTIMPSIVGIFRHCQMNYYGAAEKRSNSLLGTLIKQVFPEKPPYFEKNSKYGGCSDYLFSIDTITSISTCAPIGRSFTAKQDLAGFPVKYCR